MDVFVLWVGFLGAWLLVAGPLLQGSIELWEIGKRGQGDTPLKSADSALWLFPPALYFVQRRRIRRFEARTPQSTRHDLSSSFTNRATGWFAVAAGAGLIAVKETWELAEHYELPTTVFWIGIASLTLGSFASVAVRMWRLRKR